MDNNSVPSLTSAETLLVPYEQGVQVVLNTRGSSYRLTPDRATQLAKLLTNPDCPRFIQITTDDEGVIVINTNTIASLVPDANRAETVLALFKLHNGDKAGINASLDRDQDQPLTNAEFEYFSKLWGQYNAR